MQNKLFFQYAYEICKQQKTLCLIRHVLNVAGNKSAITSDIKIKLQVFLIFNYFICKRREIHIY